ncbi:prepilin-type N-terminal cleavage/methylation domain-containing protein [Lysobacter sp. KIS68-7]|uniref:prepilin-type N-terminal cleavage/methylation domain-containing protein n=1 Tax=Lysobacter sp. KIS68-7 TaxID=2904252 RepID=UPI001E3998EA|nr:prepilin-type N-terminal cleavage/methylation domain-containing protein [Lysobacter sp. KIS68-7]UHQ19961.1 prepilin-type N-terminal cleavage/methylation domain-containing protein [Lysobacter sp. KIS68-7]
MSARHARGFTLIEVLLATILLAAGLALAFATLRAATATAQRGEAIAQRNEHMRAVELFLRRRIGNARPIAFGMNTDTGMPRRFEGDRDHMRFVADLPDYLGRGGPYLHELTIVDGPDGPRLEVAFTMVLGATTVADNPPRKPEVLADHLHDATFRYRAMTEDNRLSDWVETWNNGDNLPVQVEITLRDADGRTWPPMIVALPLAGGYQGAAL